MEKIKKVWNSFKSGVITWVFAYLTMYVIALKINALDEYNAQVLKLIDGMNFFYQILVSGITYVILEVWIIGLMNKIIESIDKESVTKSARNIVLTIIVFIALGGLLGVVEIEKIIGTSVLTFMLCITILKAIIYVVAQQINSYIYNKKLNEKINEESN